MLMPDKLVSVIMPVYNSARYLAEAIDSVLRQSYKHFELIVIDDGSVDESGAIARNYWASGVRCYRQSNQGTAAARNAGIRRAGGDFIAHLDADDVWERHKLELQLQAFKIHPEADIVSGHVTEFFSPDLSAEIRRKIRPPREYIPGYTPPALLMRREFLERIGGFATRWTVGQDLDWLLRAREQGMNMVMLPENVVRRRLHQDNKGRRLAGEMPQRLQILKEALDRRRERHGNQIR